MAETAELLAERYGPAPRKYPRWTRYLLIVAVLVAGLVVALVAEHNLGGGPASGEVQGYQALGNSGLRLTFTLTRDSNRAVDCIVTAKDSGGTEIGRREVYVPPGPQMRTVTTDISTVSKAGTGDIYGCSYQVPAYLLPKAQVG